MTAANPQLTTRIVELYDSGLSVYQVAAEVDRAPSIVGRRLFDAEVQMRPRGGPPPPAALIAKAEALYGTGMSVRQVAQAMDWSYASTLRWLRDAGVEIRPRGRHPQEARP